MGMDDKQGSGPTETAALSDEVLEQIRSSKRTGAHGRQASLLLYSRDGVLVIPLVEGNSQVIGRAAPADVIVRDSSLSRQHASVELKDGQVWIEDLQSTNGTRLDGQRIERGQAEAGAEIVLGAVTASVHRLEPGEIRQLGLESHERFLSELECEVARANAFKRSLALLMLRPERHKLSHVFRWFPAIRERLRPFDRLGLYSHDTLEILLPEAGLSEAESLARTLAGGEQSLLCGLGVCPDNGMTAEVLVDVARTALQQASSSGRVVKAAGLKESADPSGPVAESPNMHKVFETLPRLSSSAIPVLIIGETGTGKEVVARAIHQGGKRRDQPMICVNCGGIPPQLVESTLFGHEKGSFTGATARSQGVFESADGGTVLLDEIGELPAAAQAALLRVLESKRFSRVGSQKEIEVDVRVLAATHRDLEEMVKAGDFREDLLYRLNAMTLSIPPLRERRQDIRPLVERFIRQANAANDSTVQGLEEDAMDLLERYSWPGNVRELRNAIERAVVIALGERIGVEDLPERIREGQAVAADDPDPAPEGEINLRTEMNRHEADLILRALRQADWDRNQAAALLGLPVRTLAHKMRSHGIRRTSYHKNH